MGEGEGRQTSSVTNRVGKHVEERLPVVFVDTMTEDFLVRTGQQFAQRDFLSDGCGQGCEDWRWKESVGHLDGVTFHAAALAIMLRAGEEEDEVKAVDDGSAIRCMLVVDSFPQSEARAAHGQCGLQVPGVGDDGSQEVVEARPGDGVELLEQGRVWVALHRAEQVSHLGEGEGGAQQAVLGLGVLESHQLRRGLLDLGDGSREEVADKSFGTDGSAKEFKMFFTI